MKYGGNASIPDLDAIESEINKGNIKEALEALEKAASWAEGSGDDASSARIHFLMGKALTRSGQLIESAQAYLKALDTYNKLEDDVGIAKTLLGLGVVHRWRSDFATAEDFLDRFLGLARKMKDREQIGQAHIEIGIVMAEKGDKKGTISHFKEAITILEKTDNKYQLSRAYQSLGEVLKRKGEYNEAFQNLEVCIDIAGKLDLKRNQAYASASAAECLVKSDDIEKAEKYIEKAIELFEDASDAIGLSDALRVHGAITWRSGDNKEAGGIFKRALDLIEEEDIPANEIQLRFDFAEFLISEERFEEAEVHAREALEMARRLKSPGFEDRAWKLKVKIKEGLEKKTG